MLDFGLKQSNLANSPGQRTSGILNESIQKSKFKIKNLVPYYPSFRQSLHCLYPLRQPVLVRMWVLNFKLGLCI